MCGQSGCGVASFPFSFMRVSRKLTRRSLIGRGAASPVAGQSAWATVRFSIYFSGRRSGGGGRTDWRANLCVASTGGEQTGCRHENACAW